MRLFRNWFARAAPQAPEELPSVGSEIATLLADPPRRARNAIWSDDRLLITAGLWGDGFQFPGGEVEVVRLAKPLGLSSECSLLLVGAGAGGPPRAVAEALGVWVTAFEVDQDLIDAGTELMLHSKFRRRVRIEKWDPDHPAFAQARFHHGMALEPLHDRQPEPILTAIALAIKAGGQFTMVELVADAPLNRQDATVARWSQLEHRQPDGLPTEVAITRMLGRLGFDVRTVEDISQRHVQQAMMGWRRFVRSMEETDTRPPLREVAALISEAELWMVRLRLFQSRQLRLLRWHAIARGVG